MNKATKIKSLSFGVSQTYSNNLSLSRQTPAGKQAIAARILRILLFTNLLSLNNIYAQDKAVPNDSLELSIRPYGSFRGHFAFYNDEVELQENGSRIGFEFSVKKKNARFFAGSELQMNMFKSDAVFNADANLSGGFLVVEKAQERQVFGTRLGYIGVDLQKLGTFTIGKQWGVYYDVTSYTDKFNVFGGQATATYNAGTDGGSTGTGRADQAITYRNTFGPVIAGAQLQTRTGVNNKFIDGFGLSAQVNILKGLKAGVAYNGAYLNETLIASNQVLGLKGQPAYFSIGVSYTGKKLEFGAVYANQTNGDLTRGIVNDPVQGILTPTVVYNAFGVEFYGKYKLERISLIAGYNFYQPDTDDISTPTGQKPVNPDYEKNYIILGLEYRPVSIAYFYAESRISNGTTSIGSEEFDVLTMGIRIDVEKMFSKRVML